MGKTNLGSVLLCLFKARVVSSNESKNSVVKLVVFFFLFETEGRTFILTQEMRNLLRKGTS